MQNRSKRPLRIFDRSMSRDAEEGLVVGGTRCKFGATVLKLPVFGFINGASPCRAWPAFFYPSAYCSRDMATSEYRVIESADGTFAVELWETTKRGNLLFRKYGFRTRQQADAWITPGPIIDPSPITGPDMGKRRPMWFMNVETDA